MDRQTLAAYDLDAAAFAKDWLGQPSPVDLQEVVERFFVRGGTAAAAARSPGSMRTVFRL